MTVRPATVSDAPSIAHINVQTWRVAYGGLMPDAVLDALNVERSTVGWQEWLTQKQGQVFVAEDGGSIVGFCDLIPSRDKDVNPAAVAEIAEIYVLPEHWRKGAGRTLCRSALAEAGRRGYHSLTLWVLASNVAARHFYEAMGFRLDGATKAGKLADGSRLHEVRFRIAL
jgi:ribosomal protein S18 acetylase RimI-like enzyme